MAAKIPLRSVVLLALASIICGLMTTTPKLVSAQGLVSGKYLSATGDKIVLRLSIATPAPVNLIVEQTIPVNGRRILATSPPARKIDNDLGTIKWLFKNIRDGELSLSATLTQPVHGPVATIVRYRSPIDGSFHELRITP